MKSKQRDFILGSEWIYLKLYLGHETSELVLIKYIHSIVRNLQYKFLIKKWFFVRYVDPDFHLRIRFLVSDNKKIGEIINVIYKDINILMKEKLIWKVQFDTYNRELERYGEKNIETIESMFYIDSKYTLLILKQIYLHSDKNNKWLIALKSIDSLLSNFSLNTYDKLQIMFDLSQSFKKEYGFNKYNTKQFNSKYRENKKLIESFLNPLCVTKETIIVNLIKKRSSELDYIIRSIYNKRKKKNYYSLIRDLIHMNMNRFFCSHNRLYELIIYDFMYRYYNSQLAINKLNETCI